MMSLQSQDELTRVTVTLRAIWYARRQAIHENIYQSPISTHCFVSKFVSELQATKATKVDRVAGHGIPPRWIPPPVGLAKINVDATLSKNTGVVSASAVARDSTGNFLGASALVWEGIADPETMKAIAYKKGLPLASDLVLQKFRLVCNNASVIKNMQESGLGIYGHQWRSYPLAFGSQDPDKNSEFYRTLQ